MEFEWDEDKRQKVIAERKVDMLHAALIFEGFVLTRPDPRQYGDESRFISIGLVDEDCFVVVHTPRNGATRLITAWKGGRDDRAYYEKSLIE